jgi:hypothetical protein
LLVLQAAPAAAKRRGIEVQWAELPAAVGARKVFIDLKDGAHLQGAVTAVEASSLSVDVTKTSNKSVHPLGRTSIPRVSISQIAVRDSHRIKGRLIGAGVGAGAGLALGLPLAAYNNNESGKLGGLVAAAIIVPIVLGYVAGWVGDRQPVSITITDHP